jgi:hypothetical protein
LTGQKFYRTVEKALKAAKKEIDIGGRYEEDYNEE